MALYLKYRPKDFHSLVGQDFVKQTLQAAVQNNKTVGAYLLCWPRGTGKTTTARILTKALNCIDLKEWNPCNICKICEWINNESLVDVIEIDAASHTWVDNIREIIEKAQFRPTTAKHKVYIIDEVHMLSKWAFNALLKILEEPPEYVTFILATTETHKVPDTIISRCQKYDLKSISKTDIVSRLTFVAQEEGVTIDEESLDYISQNSGWALRNALSLFEQLVTDDSITYAAIVEKLWIVDNTLLNTFCDKLLSKDSSIIEDFDGLVLEWKNIKLFFKQLLFFIKDRSIKELQTGNNISDYITILDILDDTYAKTKHSLDENVTFTIGLLKIISAYSVSQVSDTSVPKKQEDSQKIVPHNASKTLEKSPKTTQATVDNTKENTISPGDIDDIFGSETVVETRIQTASEGGTISWDIVWWSSTGFDMSAYIVALKWLGAKAWIILSLKWATYNLTSEALVLSFKTKFALNSINNTDTISLLNQWLEAVGMPDIKIQL